MKYLFVSFAAMARQLMLGKITFEDLAGGLFCLDVPRERALNWQFIRLQCMRPQDGFMAPLPAETFCRQVGLVLQAAELEGQILWPDLPDGFRSKSSLNTFLQKHGYGPVLLGFVGPVTNLGIAYAVKDAGLRLEPIALD